MSVRDMAIWRSGAAASMNGERDHAESPLLEDPPDTVQFSAAIFFGDEREGRATVDVMRLGTGRGRAKVSYHTADGSAKAGDQYEHISGELVFEDSEKEKSLQISVGDDGVWHATNEFKVHLVAPENCTLGYGLHTARIKVLDHNLFPSDKYVDFVERVQAGEEETASISGPVLFWEYFKLNFQQPGIGWRTSLVIVMDQLQNVNLLLRTWMAMHMVDVVFNVQDEETAHRLKFCSSRLGEALVLVLLYILPMMALHAWEYVKIKLDVNGLSIAFLRTNLVKRYLNLSEGSRSKLDGSRMQAAVMEEAEYLSAAYSAVADMVTSLGTLCAFAAFVFRSNPSAWWVVASIPVMVGPTVYYRGRSRSFVDEAGLAKKVLLDQLQEMLKNYKLVASFCQRPKINELVASKVHDLRQKQLPQEVEAKTDEYLLKCLGSCFVGIFVAVQAPLVLGQVPDRRVPVGAFLTMIFVIDGIVGAVSSFYNAHVRVLDAFDPLKDLTFMFALRTDLWTWRDVARHRESVSSQMRNSVELVSRGGRADERPPDSIPADRMELVLNDVCFGYSHSEPVLKNVTRSVPQGKIVAIKGRHGSGKRTLLELLGHTLFPVEGTVFIPGHLRILQVEEGTLFFDSWSPLENLTFGISHSDIDPEKIRSMLEGLCMTKTLKLLDGELRTTSPNLLAVRPEDGELEDTANGTHHWHESLSAAERSKFCLARALIANPEVLILHKPFHAYEAHAKLHVMRAVERHVRHRGAVEPEETAHLRRPRTCFYSVVDPEECSMADLVWRIAPEALAVEEEQASSSAGIVAERLPAARQGHSGATGVAGEGLDASPWLAAAPAESPAPELWLEVAPAEAASSEPAKEIALDVLDPREEHSIITEGW